MRKHLLFVTLCTRPREAFGLKNGAAVNKRITQICRDELTNIRLGAII